MRAMKRFATDLGSLRKFLRAALWMGLALGLAPGVAAAQRLQPLTPPPETYRSPQRFAFEVKFGPYLPDVDQTTGLTGIPFTETFGTLLPLQEGKFQGFRRPRSALLTTVEFDWQFWRGFGSLGFGVSAGIMRRTTTGWNANSDGTPCRFVLNEQQVCTRSGDRTAFSVLPLTLELVYRFDVLAKRWRVPFVPYLKGGVGYYIWWAESASGLASYQGSRGIGGVFGLVAHPGLAFLLDIIDPAASQVIDAELGINHVYLFAELNYAWVNGFGAETPRRLAGNINLSDLTWNAGISFEF